MNLMTFIRLTGMLARGLGGDCTGAGALGVGATDPARSTTFYTPAPSLHDAVPGGRPDGPDRVDYQLLDRTTGGIESLALPREQSWSLLSVSPWRDREGKLQAIGRWVCRTEGEEGFCGLGLISLPDMTVKNRITLDVLPTGKPCWLPGRPGEILFPAGNGRLYRCRVSDQPGEGLATRPAGPGTDGEEPAAPAREVRWEAPLAGSQVFFLDDPVWSAEPAVRQLVFVSLSKLDYRENQRVILPSRLWWLLMNDDGDAIVAAGRLTDTAMDGRPDRAMFERMPSIAVGAGGKLSLVYLARTARENSWQLRTVGLDLDQATARPRLVNGGRSPRVIADGLAPASLVVSADGAEVYAIAVSGRTVKFALPR